MGKEGGEGLRAHRWLDLGCVTSPSPPPICYAPFGSGTGENMVGETDLETRRKRLLYRSTYRGNKENDILLGQFARAHLGEFGAAELDQYERLLSVGDNDIYDWVSGKVEVPADQDSTVVRKLLAFRVRF